MATKKVKIKVTKKKVNIKKIIVVIAIFALVVLGVAYIIHIPIKNIYITGNSLLSDKIIIKEAKLDEYPPFINTFFIDIKDNLQKNDYIKEVKIKRKFPSKIIIEIEEYKPIAIYKNELLLSSGKKIQNTSVDYVPYITNDIESVYDKFIASFSKVDPDVLLKISHIEYAPNEVDKERFILYMIDSNYVHITLSKIEKINKYNSIVSELEDKKGIIYLDSGDYVEIKNKNNDWHK